MEGGENKPSEALPSLSNFLMVKAYDEIARQVEEDLLQPFLSAVEAEQESDLG